MKRGATKEEIIRATQELIAQNGIRAVRVDEIAQRVGISKRTLYEMFADKNDLVTACLEAMNCQQQQRIAACRRRRSANPLQRSLRLTSEYVDGLFTVESSFLADIRRKIIFAEQFDEHREFWITELQACLALCRDEGCLLPEIETRTLAERILEILFEMRLKGAAREELLLFCRTLLRGAATQQGIELLNRK